MIKDYIITDQEALGLNLPYKGTLYGVTIYTDDSLHNPRIAPKFLPFNYWIGFVEFFVDLFLMVSPSYVEYELPLKNLRKI